MVDEARGDLPAMRDAHVLAARIAPPSFEFKPVATRALAALLQAQPLPKLVSVCAAPGYGKSVLLSRLCEELTQRGQRCLWITLDDRDSDLSTVLYLVRAAMAQAQLAASDSDATPSAFRGRGVAIDELVAQLDPLDGTTVLFIDNLGYCHDPQLPALLERLVFGSAAGLRLVLSSTREIPVDAVRAKLELGALELGAAQLSFDRTSTTWLFQEAGLATPSDEVLARIQDQTEGWPTAVRLLQVLMTEAQRQLGPGDVPDHAQALERFSGDHSDIARLLTRRVLIGFDPELVCFMVEIALVREFSVELAAHMTGRGEAKAWLATLVARNVLIFPLDRSRRWLRFHTLMRDFLLAEGRELLSAQRRREVLERAARWHARQGDDVTALGIALDAQAIALAQTLIDRVAPVVTGEQGRMVPFIQWVDRLLSIGGVLSVQAHGWYVWALCNAMQYERARNALDSFDARVIEARNDAPDQRAAQSRLGFLRNVVNLYLDRLPEAHAGALATLAVDVPLDALSHAVAAGIAALAEIDSSELLDARRHMALAEAVMARSGSVWGMAWVAILWSCLDLAEARPAAADPRLVAVRAQVVQVIGADAHVAATIDFVRARVLLDLGRVDAARELALRGLSRAMQHGIVTSAEQGLSACAALWSGDDADALYPPTVEKVGHSYPQRMHRMLAAGRVRRCLQLGRLAEATLLAQRWQIGGAPGSTGDARMQERGDWMLAAIELQVAAGQHDDALLAIEQQLRAAQTQGRQRDRVELLLMATELHVRAQQLPRAVRSLSLAVVAAAPGKLLYPFQCRLAWLAPLLTQFKPKDFGLLQPAEQALMERLLASLAPGDAQAAQGAASQAAAPPVEMPSARELQLLALLDQGLNNQQVADRLSLSLPTVKWHLRNLYAKLGVGSRSAALARGRALNLLQRH